MAGGLTLIVVVASGVLVGGCAGTSLFGDTQSRPGGGSTTATAPAGSSSRQRAEYMRELSHAQAKLAAAERVIPRRPRTPAQLSRSIWLLASAVRHLGGDLAAITPPDAVASQHAQLVSIVRGYAVAMERAARIVGRPGGELRAGNMLISATAAATSAFASTVSTIDATLRG
jgi:hypothetical protein